MSEGIRDLERKILSSVMFDDISDYVETIKQAIPGIVEKLKEEGSSTSQEGSPSEFKEVSLKSMKESLKDELKDRGKTGRSLSPTNKDERRIDSQIKGQNPVSEASRVSKMIKDEGKMFRRGLESYNRNRYKMARKYFTRLADELLDMDPSEFEPIAGDGGEVDMANEVQKLYDYAAEVQNRYHRAEGEREDLEKVAYYLNPILKEILK